MSAMLSPKKFQFTPLREGRLLNPAEIEPMRISIHAPPRGATATAGVPSAPDPISIHAPPRGATCLHDAGNALVYFNSRPSARGDGAGATATYQRDVFQFTPLREGRRDFRWTRCGILAHFNSRPSARGDRGGFAHVRAFFISIHAPPRGATTLMSRSRTFSLFQFTPLREGRRNREYNCFIGRNFNSRPSARGDTLNDNATPWLYLFQFTPLREGRLILPREQFKHVLFQFTPLREGRRWTSASTSLARTFQFTPLREGRLLCALQAILLQHFNSRPSARGDPRR